MSHYLRPLLFDNMLNRLRPQKWKWNGNINLSGRTLPLLCCFLPGKMRPTSSVTPEKAMAHTPVLLPGKPHGWRSLVGCGPRGREELDTTERLHFHFSLSCTGEGNGNPLQCSCLENPRDGRAGGLPSMGLHRVGHAWSDLAAAAVLLIASLLTLRKKVT